MALIERIVAGDTSLFLELIRPYERGIYLVAYSVLKNPADAEETAQEAVMKAFKYLGQFRSESSFKSWVLKIASNEARMRRRKDRAHLYESLDDGGQETPEGDFMPREVTDWREVPSEALERTEIREHINRALDELPEKYREVFLLRDVQHLNDREVSEVLGISIPAVKTRLHRARLQLRERLTPVFKKRWRDRLPFFKGEKPW